MEVINSYLFETGEGKATLDEIETAFKDHSCTEGSCSLLKFLERMNQEQLAALLPFLPHLNESHQLAAMFSIGSFDLSEGQPGDKVLNEVQQRDQNLKADVLDGLVSFCTRDGSIQRVVLSTIEIVILHYKRTFVDDLELVRFFKEILEKFNLPATEGHYVARLKRVNHLHGISQQIGGAIVTLPFPVQSLYTALWSVLWKAFEDGDDVCLAGRQRYSVFWPEGSKKINSR